MSTRQNLRRSTRLQQSKEKQHHDQNFRISLEPSPSLQGPIASSMPSPSAPLAPSDRLQLSQSDSSTATAPRRRKNAPVAVSSSPAKRLRRYYNLRSSSKKESSSSSHIANVTPKHFSFESETDVYDIFNGPLMKYDDPSLVWSTQHFSTYGPTFLQHLRQQEKRECIELFGTIGPYLPCAVVEKYTIDENKWRYQGDDTDAVSHDGYEYRQRVFALKEIAELDVSKTLPRQPMITAKMRAMLVNWLSEVASEYSVSNTAFHLSVSLLDAYMASSGSESDSDDVLVHRSEFQALGCACLWIASKIEDKSPPEIDELVYISDNSVSQSQLIELEKRVCKTLEFRLHRVTPHRYIDTFLKASQAGDPSHPILLNMVDYLLELSRLPFDISYRPPSLIAAAVLYLARANLGFFHNGTSYWSPTLAHVTQYSLEEIEDTVLLLHKYQLMASESNEMNSMRNKYRQRAYHQVAWKPPVRFENLGLDYAICKSIHYEDIVFPKSKGNFATGSTKKEHQCSR